MWREEKAPGLLRRVTLPAVAVILVGLCLVVAERILKVTDGWLAVAVVVTTILTLLALHLRFLATFRCPNCGQLLSQHRDEAGNYGDQVRFLCRDCRVMWLTGLYLSND